MCSQMMAWQAEDVTLGAAVDLLQGRVQDGVRQLEQVRGAFLAVHCERAQLEAEYAQTMAKLHLCGRTLHRQ